MSARKTRIKNLFSQLETTNLKKSSSDISPVKTKRVTRSSSIGSRPKSPKANKKREKTTVAEIDLTKDEDELLPVVEKKYKENWIDSFAPTALEDLAIHPKKLQELQNWFQHCASVRKNYPAQICLLTGPSGCGKTAAVRVCAEHYKYEVQEWINPVDKEVVHLLGDQQSGDAYLGSQKEAFKSFLLRASRYKSLFNKYNQSLLLVEDFPNVLIKDAVAFEEILKDYIIYGKSPLVFVVADSKSKSLNIAHNLFTEEVKIPCRVEHISFNPIASTLMQKAMKRFCSIMKTEYDDLYKAPLANIIESIVLSSQGDIRNALINLHFSSLKGAPNVELQLVPKSKESSKKKREHSLKSVGRDESITLLHAVGRVLNPKYNDEGKLTHCPEDISEQFSTEPSKFVEFLHANYLPHFNDICQVAQTIDNLTHCDIMNSEYRSDVSSKIGLSTAVRGLMVLNKTPVSAWLPIRGCKKLKIPIRPSGQGVSLLARHSNITMKSYVTDYSTYVQIIASKSSSKIK